MGIKLNGIDITGGAPGRTGDKGETPLFSNDMDITILPVNTTPEASISGNGTTASPYKISVKIPATVATIATNSTPGIVKPDGTTIGISTDGKLSVIGELGIGGVIYGNTTPLPQYQKLGIIWIDTTGTVALFKYWNGTAWVSPAAVWV